MRLIVMHKTIPAWEADEKPSPELIRNVGQLIGEMAEKGAFVSGAGLRSSALGVRVRRSGGATALAEGPFTGENELPAGFEVLRVASRGEAVAFAEREAEILGDVEVDVRPVNEPWDIGLVPRPENLATTRFMALRKATPASEAGEPVPRARRAEWAALLDGAKARGVLLETHTLAPSRRGRRYKNTLAGVSVTDGPFAESKELIAGYSILRLGSFDEADAWTRRYLTVVGTNEVDVRVVEE